MQSNMIFPDRLLGVGGITGHKDFAKYTDIIVQPAEATKVADAIIRIYRFPNA